MTRYKLARQGIPQQATHVTLRGPTDLDMFQTRFVRAVLSRHGMLIANGLQRKVLYGWRRKVGMLKM